MKKLALFLIAFMLISCEYQIENEIKKSVKFQMRNYPESTLQDIYKNFFQDAFGPGHLIEDTEACLNNLQIELGQFESGKLKTVVEPLGYENNFVRVDLSVIKDGIVSYEDYARAFIESGIYFSEPNLDEWINEWQQIVEIIEDLDLEIQNFDADKEKLTKMLENGEYVVHHSKQFIDNYDPHYRIIQKEIFDKELLAFFE
ncbi:MAG: hypothetical protein KAS71_14550 [Bacteroidales bacterium]|nr:hypothetical protein [Bacteroidales bacterium]